jgi:ABC-type transporter Mla MlaB component
VIVREDGPGRLRLEGSVDYTNALELRSQVEQVLAAHDDVTVSLADVSDGNSLLVALFIGWFRFAHRHGHRVHFVAVPALLQTLIAFSGVDAVLPIGATELEKADV